MLYNYDNPEDDPAFLKLRVGDKVIITDQSTPGWSKGFNAEDPDETVGKNVVLSASCTVVRPLPRIYPGFGWGLW